jgi:hypothetical protein
LEEVLGPLGLMVDRDRYFNPRSLRELREQHQQERSTPGWEQPVDD